MITIPLYVIERVNNVWTLYRTEDCITWTFETRGQAENYLNKLKYLKEK